jgi:hypothetical protein
MVVALLGLGGCAGAVTPPPPPERTPLPYLRTPTIIVEPSEAPEPSVRDLPDDAGAYLALLAAIPSDIAGACEQVSYASGFPREPGELIGADCDLRNGSAADFVNYKLFDGNASMDAFYDLQRRAIEEGGTLDGPGCGRGPGHGTWDVGRKMCYRFITDDANVQWTHDLLSVSAHAWNGNGDFAALETFWATAGPITP